MVCKVEQSLPKGQRQRESAQPSPELLALTASEGLARYAILPEHLPTPLARPWAELWAETHPRVRLHWLTDVLELTVRWATAVALAENLRRHDGALPPQLQRVTQAHIERPTLGRWMLLLRELSAAGHSQDGLGQRLATLSARIDQTSPKGGTLETSLVALRNHVAHSGGLSTQLAQRLVQRHIGTVAGLLAAAVSATSPYRLLGRAAGSTFLLEGPEGRPIEGDPVAERLPDGLWLVGDETWVTLAPLVLFGPVRRVSQAGRLHAAPGPPSPQVFARLERDRVSYTPIGRDEPTAATLDVQPFRALFGLDARPPREDDATDLDEESTGFVAEAQTLAEELVGRGEELERGWSWLLARRPWDDRTRTGWIGAGPGVGKSMLMACLACRWAARAEDNPRHRGLYLHRFRAGDARNNLRAFLAGLVEALAAWPPLNGVPLDRGWRTHDADELLADAQLLMGALVERRPSRAKWRAGATTPLFVVFVDGLDEVIQEEPTLPRVLRKLAGPGAALLAAGRPAHGLAAAFGGPGSEELYPGGLGPMADQDIHGMLLAGLGSGRFALLARDEDRVGGVHNAFVQGVVDNAGGLPLYVHLLLEDLRAGALTVRDEDKLPHGLQAYYDDLSRRMGLSTVQRDLPLLVATLAVAEEPLDSGALSQLLSAPYLEDEAIFAPRVEAALRVGVSLMRSAPTPERTSGHALYHQSYREYVAGDFSDGSTPGSAGSPLLTETVAEARRRLFRAAALWESLPEGNLRRHLFRWGTEYSLWWERDGALAAAKRLMDVGYLQARTSRMDAAETNDLIREYGAVQAALPTGALADEFRIWATFVRERAHCLRRSHPGWRADRILLQLAWEHADDSPVTRAAERWCATSHTAPPSLCSGTRSPRLERDALLHVLEGHTARIREALVDGERRLVTLAGDGVRVWSRASGECLQVIDVASEAPQVRLVAPGRLLCDGSLWDIEAGRLLASVRVLAEGDRYGTPGCLVAGDQNGWLHFVSVADGQRERSLRFGRRPIVSLAPLTPERALAAGLGGAMWLWDPTTGEVVAELPGQRGAIHQALLLPVGRAAAAKGKGVLVFGLEDGDVLSAWREPSGARTLLQAAGQLVVGYWSGRIERRSADGLEVLWDTGSSEPGLETTPGHDGEAEWLLTPAGALVATPSSIRWHAVPAGLRAKLRRLITAPGAAPVALVTGEEGVLAARLDQEGPTDTTTIAPQRCSTRPKGRLPDGRLWGTAGQSAWVWEAEHPQQAIELTGHRRAVRSLVWADNLGLVTFAGDDEIRVHDVDSGAGLLTLRGHGGPVRGVRWLPAARRLLSWGEDQQVLLWAPPASEPIRSENGPGCDVGMVTQLDHETLLSCSPTGTMRIWGADGTPAGVLQGHSAEVDQWVRLGDHGLLTWCAGDDDDKDTSARVWDLRAAGPTTTQRERAHTSAVLGAAPVEGEEPTLLSWAEDRTVRVWTRERGEPLGKALIHPGPLHGVRLLDNDRLLTWQANRPARLHLWDVARLTRQGSDQRPLATLKGHAGTLRSVEVLANEAILSQGPARLVVWDVRRACERARFPTGRSRIEQVETLASGERIIAWSRSDQLQITRWDPLGVEPTATSGVPRGGRLLVAGDEAVLLWLVKEGTLQRWVPGETEPRWSLSAERFAGSYSVRAWAAGALLNSRNGGCLVVDSAGEVVLERSAVWEYGYVDAEHFGVAGRDLLVAECPREGAVVALDLRSGAEVDRAVPVGPQAARGEPLFLDPPFLSLDEGTFLLPSYGGRAVAWRPGTGKAAVLPLAGSETGEPACAGDDTWVLRAESGELIQWCAVDNQVVAQGSPRALLRRAPRAALAWLSRRRPRLVRAGVAAWGDAAGVVLREPSGRVLEWHASGQWAVHEVTPGGRVVASSGPHLRVLGAARSGAGREEPRDQTH